MKILPAKERILSVLTAWCCFLVSAIALLFILHGLDCAKHHLLGSDPQCPTKLDWQFFLLNPFVLLTAFFLIALGTLSVQKANAVARRTLLWWAILFVGLIGVMQFM